MTAFFRAKSTGDICICNCDLYCSSWLQSTGSVRYVQRIGVSWSWNFACQSWQFWDLHFLKKALCYTEAAQEYILEVCYRENGLSGIDKSLLGLVGKVERALVVFHCTYSGSVIVEANESISKFTYSVLKCTISSNIQSPGERHRMGAVFSLPSNSK